MHPIEKHTALLKELMEKTSLLQTCQRVSIEQKFPPFFRTYVAIGSPMDKAKVREIEDIAESLTLHANPFYAGPNVNAITFTDMDEQVRS